MFKPLNDRVMVNRDDDVKESKGRIILSTADEQYTGIVMAVGPGSYTNKGAFVPTQVKPGDRVMFGKWTGKEIEGCVLMSEAEILGIIEPDT